MKFLAILLLLISCKSKESSLNNRQAKSVQDAQRKTPIELKKKIEGKKVKKDVKKNIGSVYNYKKNNDYLLTPEASSKILSEDFEIGPLYNVISKNKSDNLIMRDLKLFIEKLISANIKEDLLYPEYRGILKTILSDNIEKKNLPETYLIGAAEYGNEFIKVNVRLTKDKARTKGVFLFKKEDGKWYIFDFNINFHELNALYIKKEFDPMDKNLNNNIEG